MATGSLQMMTVDPNAPDYHFHAQIGRTLVQWGQIEAALCLFFAHFGKMPAAIARRIFYSVEGFRPRSKLLQAALASTTQSGITDFLEYMVGRARTYAGQRNLVAHGDVVTVQEAGSPYDGQIIIIQGREQSASSLSRTEVITSDDLTTMCGTFALFSSLLFSALNGPPPELQELRELAGLLPGEAHRTRLDQKSLERFAIVPASLRVWR